MLSALWSFKEKLETQIFIGNFLSFQYWQLIQIFNVNDIKGMRRLNEMPQTGKIFAKDISDKGLLSKT